MERLRDLDDRFHQLKKDMRVNLVDVLNERYGGKLEIDDNEFKWMYDRGMDIVLSKYLDDEDAPVMVSIHGLMVEHDSPYVIVEDGTEWLIYSMDEMLYAMEFIFNHENYLFNIEKEERDGQ